MNGKAKCAVLLLLALGLTCPGQISSGGSFSLEKSVVAGGGGGGSQGGAFTVAGTSGQNAAGTGTQTGAFFQIGGFWTTDPFGPTAALVSISGRVSTLSGNGIRNVVVTLVDSQGGVRTAVTGSLGTYRFTDVEIGQTYVLSVRAKRFTFQNPSLIVTVDEELAGLDFRADD